MIADHARSRIVAIARVLLVLAVLFTMYEMIIPDPVPAPRMVNGDKLLHGLAFFVLTLLTDMSFPPVRLLVKKLLFLVAFGVLIECVQAYLPWRSADIADFLADCAGIACYLVPAIASRMAALLHEG